MRESMNQTSALVVHSHRIMLTDYVHARMQPSSSAPHELFYDCIEELEDNYAPDKKILKERFKVAFAPPDDLTVASLSADDFIAKLKENGGDAKVLDAMDPEHLAVFYQEVCSA
jgi:hypothetical protein